MVVLSPTDIIVAVMFCLGIWHATLGRKQSPAVSIRRITPSKKWSNRSL